MNRTMLMILPLLIMTVPTAFAQESLNSINVQTDNSSYYFGDMIVISGQVIEYDSGVPLDLIIKDPNGDLALIVQVGVGADKNYNTIINTDELFQIEGIYTIIVQYGTSSSETIFEINQVITTDELTPEETGCGRGSTYDPITTWCIIDDYEPITLEQVPRDEYQPEPVMETIIETTTPIPAWVKGIAGFWAQGLITDEEFIEGMQYLVDNGILIL